MTEREIRQTEAERFLWETIGQPLLAQEIRVFLGVMNEDPTPEDYVLLRYDVTDVAREFGDGSAQIRASDCDIIVVGNNTINDNWVVENAWEVQKILDGLEINYQTIDNGFDERTNTSSITITLNHQYQRG